MSDPSTTVVLMDQYADTQATTAGNVVQSPLAHVGLSPCSSAEDGHSLSTKISPQVSVDLIEHPVIGLLTVRARTATGELDEALTKRLSMSLPDRLGTDTADNYCIRWMSPDEWLLSCPLDEAYTIEKDLRSLVSGSIAIVNVSGGYSVLEIHGPDAINVLKKSTAYDVSSRNFGVGKVVNTSFAKTQVTLRAIQLDHFEVVVRRSFADYMWLWLQRAGKEYGLQAFASDT